MYQNFVKDIYQALLTAKEKLNRYQKLVLLFPGFKEPQGMVEGFLKFCLEFHFVHEVIVDFDGKTIAVGEVFIIPNDRHLVQVIEQSKQQQLRIGHDFGIISYNDTPLKKVVENGITTISTDFKKMGKLLAEMVLTNQKLSIENDCQMTVRNSL